MTIAFFVEGNPVPQPRHRTRVVHSKRGPVAHTYEATGDHPIHTWKEAIAWQARIWRPTEPMAGPLSLELVFGLHAPASMIRCAKTDPHLRTEHAIGRSDIDNYAKAVMDVLTALRFWCDDNQITDLHARKYWRLPDEPAGVRVTIHELASEPVEEASTNV